VNVERGEPRQPALEIPSADQRLSHRIIGVERRGVGKYLTAERRGESHAMRLDPAGHLDYALALGGGYDVLRRYQDAIVVLEPAVAQFPNNLPGHSALRILSVGVTRVRAVKRAGRT
jgi:hypothetical protein